MDKELREELLRLNDQVAEAATKRRALTHREQKLRDEAELLRAQAVVDVVESKDERGKPRYSNEYAVRAAATVALHRHQRYQEIVAERETLWEQIQPLQAESGGITGRQKILMVEAGIMDPLDLAGDSF